MKKPILTILLLSICLTAFGQKGEKLITVDEYTKTSTFRIANVPGFNAMKDGQHFVKISRNGNVFKLEKFNISDGQKVATLFNSAQNTFEGKTQLKISNYAFSQDESKLLLLTEPKPVYRHSTYYTVYVFDLASQNITLVDESPILHAQFNPQANQVAFVKENNLFIKNLTNQTLKQVTHDGKWNHIINGNCDWVYEEEFSFTQAYQWSPSGQYIAFYRFDESQVPTFTISNYIGKNPQPYSYKYPQAGEANSVVSIHFYNVNSGKMTTADVGKNQDQYIPRIKWTNTDEALCIVRLNRHQNKMDYLLSKPTTGKSQLIYTDTDQYYVEVTDNFQFLKDGKSFLLTSEQEGFNQIYVYNWVKKKLTKLTKGKYDVDQLFGINPDNGKVYFSAAKDSPLERGLYAVDLKGKTLKSITQNKGYHAVRGVSGLKYFIDNFSTLNSVPVISLIDYEGKTVRVLENNSVLKSNMEKYSLGEVKLMKVPGADAELNAYMMTPPNFDKNKKYPVLMFQYSGPGSQQVANKFGLGYYFWHQMLAQKGYIIFCVDGTGTGFRGAEFKKKTYLTLGDKESDDQIAVAKYLSEKSFVDADRIGIWGWSFGGFMSSTCLMKGASVFKMAIAVAPVTNWRFYDNIYTERFMRLPKENESGYDDNAPERMVEKLKGKLLLIHGTGDDNVHFLNSAVMAEKMIQAGKSFDSEFYPDKTHGISGGNTRNHLFHRMTDFIIENL